ncbi:hydroxylysine kinase /5-phosphonooxy-L-lysine phospho-lyase apoenzyme [Microbacterium sp. cf046]|uniref:aminotransferase n=1 Tax=Microbacterium sp. cf046 TaxID=1761803 RepID=UPI0008EEEF5D|nr:aminotransferase [Microbacterium sp. cf046]SFS09356.1 hydroxylysine kinase /5-phosphonooxy-L-lysine phospho-lyase apoenzyme [Microbacterium sp. cf046]
MTAEGLEAAATGAALVQPAPPEIGDATAERIASEGWGVSGRARALGSHQDRNFLITPDTGARVLLKIANPSVTAPELEAQSAAAAAITSAGVRAARALPVGDGATARAVEVDGVKMQARLLEFLEGETLSGYLSPAAVRAIGALAATVDVALADLVAPAAERVHQWDLREAPGVLDELLPYVSDDELRNELSAAAESAWDAVAAVADRLPVQFIHGDLTDDNVVTGDAVTRIPDGVIDLGDLNRTWTVGELAITVSSLLHHDGMDLAGAMQAIAAYHAIRPISETEADALWALVVVRGAVLVASAHHVLATDAANEYAAENLVHEREIFSQAVSVPLPVATALVRAYTGHTAAPLDVTGEALLPGLTAADVRVVDLSAASPALHDGRWLAASAEDDLFVESVAVGGTAVGRFGEARLTRSRADDPEPPRNVALGVEFQCPVAQPVAAPWAGTVRLRSAGIELRTAELTLRLDGCRTTLADGTTVEAGEVIGQAAGSMWVQVMRAGVEAPRFVTASLAAAWRTVAADPGALVPELDAAGATPDAAELLKRRDGSFADVQEHYYADPPIMVRGWREHLVDADGRVYLDTLNNVTSVGHAHPRLVAAVAEQWRLLNTNSRFHYPAVVEFSERLASLAPDPLDTVFLVNSGSEAVDLALRLAQAWSGRREVLAVAEAYHGWTYLTDAVSTSVADNPAALETRPDWVHTVAAPIPFRGSHAESGADAYAQDAVAEVGRLADAGTPAGAFLSETVFGNAGGVMLPDGYLDAVYRAVRAHGGLAIADEVQVGYGRLGEWFWGFEQQGVVPDVIAIAKAMGNGHPLGAVITSREIAEQYREGGYFFSSAGGSPVSSVVGLTVLDIIRDERLQENARETGAHLKGRLEDLGRRHPILAAVHGSGFYLGPEFVRDRETWEPATAETAAICERLRELGVIAQPTGDHQNLLKIKPPMCFSRESADAFVDALDRVLTTGW